MQASVAQQNQILQLQIIDSEIMQAIAPYPSNICSNSQMSDQLTKMGAESRKN
jgi:hypothetical protein